MAELTLEQRKALALARARQRAAQAGGARSFGQQATDFLGHVNRPIMGALDVVTEPFERLAGVELDDVARRQGVAIADKPPQGYAESAAEGIGLAAGALLPGGAAVGAATRAASPVVSGAARSMAEPFLRSPVATTAAEVGFGASAGLGGQAAEDAGAPRWAGEMAGGLAPLAPFAAVRAADKTIGALPVTGSLWRWGKRNLMGMTEAGGRQRAHERLREVSGQPEKDIKALEQSDPFGLTPAQRTGNPRMMQLERSVRDVEPEFDVATREGLESINDRLAEAMRDMAQGAQAQDATRYIRGTRGVIRESLEKAVGDAETQAQQRLADVTPAMKESQASAIYREELEGALKSAKDMERELWGQVPQEVTVPTTGAREAFQSFRQTLGRAQQDDIPEEAVRFLDPDRNSAFGEEESVREMHALSSKLRETARNARGGDNPNRNKARIADELAEAIMRDLEQAGDDVASPFGTARAFTRELNEKFSQGRVGEILNLSPRGGARVPGEATLDRAVGQGGVRAAVSMDELRRATAGSENAEQAAREYLRNRFTRLAVGQQGVNARRFLRDNDELLDRFPDLKAQMREVAESSEFAQTARREVDTGLKEAAQAPAAKFAEAPFGREFETILQSQNPRQAAREVVRAARNDPSGKALGGLKDAALDYLMKHRGEMSLRSFRNALQDERISGPIREILEPGELQRLGQIVGTMERARLAERATPAAGGVIDDTPNTILNTLAGVVGAQVGRRVAANTGGGTVQTPGIFAGRFRGALARLTSDKAEQLLRDAVKDPDLMKSLMISPNVPAKRIPGRLKTWLAAETGVAAGGEDESEQRQRQSSLSNRAQAATLPDRGPEAYRKTADTMAKRYGVDPGLFQRVVQAESNWNPRAKSPKGAFGLTQVMPATAEKPGFGVKPLKYPNDPADQLRFGAQYLAAMLRRYKGDLERALVAYNWGPGHADKWSGRAEDLPEETRNYVRKIAA